jgi:hypothetical protein
LFHKIKASAVLTRLSHNKTIKPLFETVIKFPVKDVVTRRRNAPEAIEQKVKMKTFSLFPLR